MNRRLFASQASLVRACARVALALSALMFASGAALRAQLQVQNTYATPYAFTTFAGNSGFGTNDGTGGAAGFAFTAGAALDGAGNLYVADFSNHTIRKITPAGVVTTFAGSAGASGSADGTGQAARFFGPIGVAVDGVGNVYVADCFNNTIRKITPTGAVTTLAGAAGSQGSTNGAGGAARFFGPQGVAVDGASNVYVADSDNNAIRVITPAGVVTTLAGTAGTSGSTDATGAAARFNFPVGIAVDGAGNAYVADSDNNAIRKVTPAGAVTTLAGSAAGSGAADGMGAAARFNFPSGIASDAGGTLYVSDSGNHTIRKITPAGAVTTLAGSPGTSGSADGTGSAARFNQPYMGVAVDGAGNLSVSDSANFTVRRVTAAGVVTTFAGSPRDSVGSADGAGGAARFKSPGGVAADGAGALYVADSANNTIRKITVAGVVTTFAGSPVDSGSADGVGGAARFMSPVGVAVDAAGVVYVTDTGNHTIRKITPGGVVTTFAGAAGVSGATNATGTAARFNEPVGIGLDGAGNVYVADRGNYTIRKITPGGVVTTLAGTAGAAGLTNATGAAARFQNVTGLAVDGNGVVYVADRDNVAIRKITPAGVVTTLAGNGTRASVDATGGAARFNDPVGVAVDGAGTVFVVENDNCMVRKITSAGVVTSLAGMSESEGAADGTGAAALFNYPGGIAVDAAGALYVADIESNTIRRGVAAPYAPAIVTQPGSAATVVGSTLTLSVAVTGTAPLSYQWLRDGAPIAGATSGVFTLANVQLTDAGTGRYSVTVSNATGSVTSSAVTLRVAVEQPYTFATIAGQSNSGTTDGPALSARFSGPFGAVAGPDGTLYIGDSSNHTIRKISPAGVVSTFAGKPGTYGTADGAGSAARFNSPGGLSLDGAGNLYVADFNNHSIRKVTPAGVVTTLAGLNGAFGTADGTGTEARFNQPTGTAVDGAGNVFAVDGQGSVRRITPAGVVTTFAGSTGTQGNVDGAAVIARFTGLRGIAIDGAGNLYVSEGRIVRKITPAGVVSTLAGLSGAAAANTDGNGSAARFNSLRGIAIDAGGNLYLADSGAHTIRKITPAGDVTTLAGTVSSLGATDGAGTAARFNGPIAVTLSPDGNFYIADSGNSTIRRMTAAGEVTLFAGAVTRTSGIDGTGTAAEFNTPGDTALDAAGNLYISDSANHTIRKMAPNGAVTTLAGSAGLPGTTDATGSAARFSTPQGLAVDGAGNVYVADLANQTIRKITPAGAVTVFAGLAGSTGTTDGTGAAARFSTPRDVAIDGAGNLYVADQGNHTIRKITPAGAVTTLAGTGGSSGSGDGAGAAARFNNPWNIAVDGAGNVYVADRSSSSLRKITPAGQVTTLVRFSALVLGVAADAAGNAYVGSSASVWKYTTAGELIFLGGGFATSSVGSADGVGHDALFQSTAGLSVDAAGALYVPDSVRHTISRATSSPVPPLFHAQPLSPGGTAPGASATFTVAAGGNPLPTIQWRRNGADIPGATGASLTVANVQPADGGLYQAAATNAAGTTLSAPAILGVTTTSKVVGEGAEVGFNIVHPNGNIFDQVLLSGAAAAVTADPGQITRTSFLDLTDDIVQVEFSGAGTLSLVLAGSSGPVAPAKYNQAVTYMRGHVGIVIVGANETTNVGVFSVGRITAVNQALFKNDTTYDGLADVAFIAIASTDGKFGGLRAANGSFFATSGVTGVYAPGVQFGGPVFVGDISAFDAATPVHRLGSAGDTRITGGDLFQTNGRAVQVSGLTQLKMAPGTDSHGTLFPAKTCMARLVDVNGVDVTDQIVVNPTP